MRSFCWCAFNSGGRPCVQPQEKWTVEEERAEETKEERKGEEREGGGRDGGLRCVVICLF